MMMRLLQQSENNFEHVHQSDSKTLKSNIYRAETCTRTCYLTSLFGTCFCDPSPATMGQSWPPSMAIAAPHTDPQFHQISVIQSAVKTYIFTSSQRNSYPKPECHNEVQAICREDAQSHRIFRADLFELKEVHTQFKELMKLQALNTTNSHHSPPVWSDFLPPYRPFWPFQELVDHISCWWSVACASTLAGPMKTELRSGMETLNPNKPGSYIPTSGMKKIQGLSDSAFTSILSSSILFSKFIQVTTGPTPEDLRELLSYLISEKITGPNSSFLPPNWFHAC